MKFSLLKLLAVVTWVCLLLGFIATLAPHPLDWDAFWAGWHDHRGFPGGDVRSFKWGSHVHFCVNVAWFLTLVLSAIAILIWFIPDGPVSEEDEEDEGPGENGEAE